MLRKSELLEAIASTNRGLLVSDDERLAILALVARLEDSNPTPRPLEAAELLEGNWRLLYTTSDELLGIDRVPLVKLGHIYQCVRLAETRIYNLAEVGTLPYLEGLVSVAATFEAVSDKRVTVRFQRAVFGLQWLLGYQSPNQFIAKLMQSEKLTLLQGVDFEINREQSGWLEITYLDADMRIGRGNQGSVFVLKKVANR
ncbi:MAG: fibrillin [Leptolyngbya sp. SIO4C1]|nr:fibrillin [Leptolyngbya sp. SIO4C1]